MAAHRCWGTLANCCRAFPRRCLQEKEARNQLQSAVDEDGSLLDNLTLELRVHPPSIDIDNHSHEQWTTVTIDSANRPGSLIYVSACYAAVQLVSCAVLLWFCMRLCLAVDAPCCHCCGTSRACAALCMLVPLPACHGSCGALPTCIINNPSIKACHACRWCNTSLSWTCASAPPASPQTAAGSWMVRRGCRLLWVACGRLGEELVCICIVRPGSRPRHAPDTLGTLRHYIFPPLAMFAANTTAVFHLAEANGEKVRAAGGMVLKWHGGPPCALQWPCKSAAATLMPLLS